MKKYKTLIIAILMTPIFCLGLATQIFRGEDFVLAEDGDIGESFVIYDEDLEVLCEKSGIEEGDIFVSKDFYEYEIYKVEGRKGYARKLERLDVPKIKRKDLSTSPISSSSRGKLCLYMTHNDESFVPSDGYSSIYGAGGIHDVAKEFQEKLQNKGINVVLDESLHIPHDSKAYTRSSVTANKLLSQQDPDAMFDIHRDGVGKSYYYTKQGDLNLSRIRIVVGKSNPYFSENYAFAKKIFAIGNSMYPWLFSDIYCGKGHYNQALLPNNLLFEMGTYLIEKEYVLNSLPFLAEVVNIALYASEEDKKGNIVVDKNSPETTENPIVVDDASQNGGSLAWLGWSVLALTLAGGATAMVYFFYIKKKIKRKRKKVK